MVNVLSFFSIFLTLGLFVIFSILAYMVNVIFLLMPILLVGSLVGLWHFIKMEPSKKWTRYAKIGIVVGLIGSISSFSLGAGMFRPHRIRHMAPEDRYELQVEENVKGHSL